MQDAYDLIVVGSGAGGLSAASTAAVLGARVLVLEAASHVGGTTAISGGMVWIPNNHKMAEAGLADSAEAAREYLSRTVPGFDEPRMNAFLARGDEAVRFLEKHTALRLRPVPRYPDYYPEVPGSTPGGRVLEPVPFNGHELGPDFARLRDPLPEFLLFGGMMVSREDLPVLRRVTRSPRALLHAARLFARYLRQRLRAHRGTSLVLGNALAARLYKSARDLGVEIALGTAVTGIVVEGGRAAGVRAQVRGQEVVVRANRAVVLATGGISHFPELRKQFVPAEAGDLSATMRSGARQSGADLALRAGAQLSERAQSVDEALAFWVPASTFPRADGSQGVFPHTVTDRAKPGLIAVNREGRRFVNEAVSYHEFVRAQLREGRRAIPAWLVCDSKFLWKYGLGRVRPFALSTAADVRSGYLKKADSLGALARQMGVAPRVFEATVDRFNEGARQGLDPEFGRGANIYQRHLGDAEQQPNPCVAPIQHGPFYAVAVHPADLGMAAGILTDRDSRVLRADGQAIEGLYAVGNDMHSVMNGAYPGPGITLGPALVFGYLAATHACGGAGAARAAAGAAANAA